MLLFAGKQVKACFGTTKYCNAFLKGVACNNPDCLYLHDIGNMARHVSCNSQQSIRQLHHTSQG